MKKKPILYYVELHGLEDTYIFLVGKDLIDWIDNLLFKKGKCL